MHFRPLIALVLCLGLQTSLCTGGALATMSGVSDFFAYQSVEDAPMSFGSIGYLTCENNAKGEGVGSVESGCGDASDCLLQAFGYSRDQSLLVFEGFSENIAPLLPSFAKIEVIQTSLLASRDGPVYEQPRLLAHTLLKRE